MIQQFIFYFWMQLKKSIKMMRNALISLMCIALVIAGSALLVKALLQRQDSFDKVTVGIVITDGSKETKTIFRLLYAMESVNSICSFTYVDEDEVYEELINGNLKAALVLAPDFYDDVNYGTNTPVKLLLGEEGDFETTFFYELVMNGCELIRTTEAAIYAASDEIGIYETSISISEMQDMLIKIYIENILTRYDAFAQILLSPTGNYDLSQYYFIAILCMLLLMFGLNYGMLYQREEFLIFRILRREGLSNLSFTIVKTVAMAIPLWIFSFCWYGFSLVICHFMHSSFIVWDWRMVFLTGVVSVGIASYFHLFYSLFNDSARSGMILFVLNIIMLLMTGAFLPVSYMPEIVGKFQAWLPLHIWWEALGNGFFQETVFSASWKVLLQIVIFEMIGVWKICRKA